MLAPLALATVDLPRPGVAEDAPALATERRGVALLGVFDGAGGAGARRVDGEDGRRSSAYYAARIARAAAEQTFVDASGDAAVFAASLPAAIGARLAARNRVAPPVSGALRSALLRRYPTTAALLVVSGAQSGVDVLALWAGDSRCYALTPGMGLQQLTLDDTGAASDPRGGDAPMTNLLCAERPPLLRANRQCVQAPAIVLAASDGAYAALPSPILFERLLLEALADADGPASWAAGVGRRLAPIADDDVSLAAACVGWAPGAFAPRRAALARLLDASPACAWARYRPGYMALAGAA